jgi:hypothetical protein
VLLRGVACSLAFQAHALDLQYRLFAPKSALSITERIRAANELMEGAESIQPANEERLWQR